MHSTHGWACHPSEPHKRTIISRPTPGSSMEKPHGYLHDIASVHVIACNATSENPAKHLQTRGIATEPSYLVLARVTLTVPVTAIVIQGGPGKILERRADRVLAAMFLIKYHKKQRIRGLVVSPLALDIRLVDFAQALVVQASRHIHVCLVWG
ncbi:hypothetical protein FVEG_15130 [Fusarium verticillioides 7600]|uniref:Uncharacterized protein n=1 Tax=Gibberella moniliformis (strain M3125 / FGSC 7600) TaxID=334819 RepID=W7LYD1_GIBM7|nr:hypothetical protein FVEG_15130 [Fusarium verticillioides 7600]EWG40369.1 hypothetical protein FVEG_15130 [Fusarium verticillioides 7600]